MSTKLRALPVRAGTLLTVGGICGVFVGLGGWALSPYVASLSWPETTCEILDARVSLDESDDGDSWSARVSWQYQVGDVQYRRINHEPEAFSVGYDEDDAHDAAARYPPGSHLPCYYDPATPNRSVLDHSAPPLSFWLLVGGALCGLIVSMVLLVLGRRSRSSPQNGAEPRG